METKLTDKTMHLFLVQAISDDRELIVTAAIGATSANQALDTLIKYNAFKMLSPNGEEYDPNGEEYDPRYWYSAYIIPTMTPITDDKPLIYTFTVN